VTVRFLLPGGRQVNRVFPVAAAAGALFDAVVSKEGSPQNFSLFTRHPRQEVPQQGSLENILVGRNIILVVEENDPPPEPADDHPQKHVDEGKCDSFNLTFR
jgi:hypothetical protein